MALTGDFNADLKTPGQEIHLAHIDVYINLREALLAEYIYSYFVVETRSLYDAFSTAADIVNESVTAQLQTLFATYTSNECCAAIEPALHEGRDKARKRLQKDINALGLHGGQESFSRRDIEWDVDEGRAIERIQSQDRIVYESYRANKRNLLLLGIPHEDVIIATLDNTLKETLDNLLRDVNLIMAEYELDDDLYYMIATIIKQARDMHVHEEQFMLHWLTEQREAGMLAATLEKLSGDRRGDSVQSCGCEVESP